MCSITNPDKQLSYRQICHGTGQVERGPEVSRTEHTVNHFRTSVGQQQQKWLDVRPAIRKTNIKKENNTPHTMIYGLNISWMNYLLPGLLILNLI